MGCEMTYRSIPRSCRRCGASEPEAYISRRHLCADCGEELALDSQRQLAAGEGPLYDLWKQRHIEGMSAHMAKRRQLREQQGDETRAGVKT